MTNLDPSSVGATVKSEGSLTDIQRRATQNSATPSASTLYGGQAQPSSSFGADLGAAQSASTGYTQGANASAGLTGAYSNAGVGSYNYNTTLAGTGTPTGLAAASPGAGGVSAAYGDQGATDALNQDSDTHDQFKM